MNGSNTTISSKRFVTVSGKDTYSESYTLENLEAYIEPINAEAAKNFADENVFMLHTLIIEDAVDMLISDLVIDADGVEYIVKGVKKYNGGELPSHTEAVLATKRPIA